MKRAWAAALGDRSPVTETCTHLVANGTNDGGRPARILPLYWAAVCMYHRVTTALTPVPIRFGSSIFPDRKCDPLTVENGVMVNADVCTAGDYGE